MTSGKGLSDPRMRPWFSGRCSTYIRLSVLFELFGAVLASDVGVTQWGWACTSKPPNMLPLGSLSALPWEPFTLPLPKDGIRASDMAEPAVVCLIDGK